MVRAPCCEKMGLKKGPWTREEDEILISYIKQHGHGNWRALPKQAGLLRCGKSCRLRWTNYLRPDIKRGNFSNEEEETIIKLHHLLGNRWSAIAARLPGRTDNEIKNVWHTHLKKKLKNYKNCSDTIAENSGPRAADLCAVSLTDTKCCTTTVTLPKCDSNVPIQSNHPGNGSSRCGPVSPQPSSSELSSVSDANVPPSSMVIIKDEQMDTSIDNTFPEIKESFWTEQFSADNSDHPELQLQFPWSPVTSMVEHVNECGFNIGDVNDFWYNIFTRAGDLPELPEF